MPKMIYICILLIYSDVTMAAIFSSVRGPLTLSTDLRNFLEVVLLEWLLLAPHMDYLMTNSCYL